MITTSSDEVKQILESGPDTVLEKDWMNMPDEPEYNPDLDYKYRGDSF